MWSPIQTLKCFMFTAILRITQYETTCINDSTAILSLGGLWSRHHSGRKFSVYWPLFWAPRPIMYFQSCQPRPPTVGKCVHCGPIFLVYSCLYYRSPVVFGHEHTAGSSNSDLSLAVHGVQDLYYLQRPIWWGNKPSWTTTWDTVFTWLNASAFPIRH